MSESENAACLSVGVKAEDSFRCFMSSMLPLSVQRCWGSVFGEREVHHCRGCQTIIELMRRDTNIFNTHRQSGDSFT